MCPIKALLYSTLYHRLLSSREYSIALGKCNPLLNFALKKKMHVCRENNDIYGQYSIILTALKMQWISPYNV